ncbi:hypothetical protein Tco_0526399 [Tanacetum coccineum]
MDHFRSFNNNNNAPRLAVTMEVVLVGGCDSRGGDEVIACRWRRVKMVVSAVGGEGDGVVVRGGGGHGGEVIWWSGEDGGGGRGDDGSDACGGEDGVDGEMVAAVEGGR